ncbi:unnamed protein product [Pleuronectes platessa]|uniref:Uncharacterized protein n=1 Tax=Pleuronectes platessa TaxID=8262 RepID=A0A9N7U1M9_PLEPL|nr:unnamed protein product [Pleuronectes platessa]
MFIQSVAAGTLLVTLRWDCLRGQFPLYGTYMMLHMEEQNTNVGFTLELGCDSVPLHLLWFPSIPRPPLVSLLFVSETDLIGCSSVLSADNTPCEDLHVPAAALWRTLHRGLCVLQRCPVFDFMLSADWTEDVNPVPRSVVFLMSCGSGVKHIMNKIMETSELEKREEHGSTSPLRHTAKNRPGVGRAVSASNLFQLKDFVALPGDVNSLDRSEEKPAEEEEDVTAQTNRGDAEDEASNEEAGDKYENYRVKMMIVTR